VRVRAMDWMGSAQASCPAELYICRGRRKRVRVRHRARRATMHGTVRKLTRRNFVKQNRSISNKLTADHANKRSADVLITVPFTDKKNEIVKGTIDLSCLLG
jgi:hypothetical protein